jgi:trans-L-3-hydroxyproline dehydratase
MLDRSGPMAEVVYDAPAGLIRARATIDNGRVTSVAFTNVPAFLFARDVDLDISIGSVRVDIAYGGAFYALIDAAALGIAVLPENAARLSALGMEIKRAIDARMEVVHPEEPKLRGMYGTIICDAPRGEGADGRNITIYAEGAVDRSPCGTGTSARLAALFADQRIGHDQPYIHESVIGTTFTGRVVAETTVGEIPAVITEISGRGFLTGIHQFVFDPADPTVGGFLVR